ncbi:MAG: hypothetical protein LBF40_04960 [Deltaproteobacteria bacterium]|jgi:hypothetical protein|nr:hypothetical protein [Deltaproteobacteria bacterium]
MADGKDALSDITREEAQAALDNPETGSLRVLKQVGKLRDLYAKELASGKRRLEARNPVEEVAAEAAARDFTELARAEGKDGPSGITIARVGF